MRDRTSRSFPVLLALALAVGCSSPPPTPGPSPSPSPAPIPSPPASPTPSPSVSPSPTPTASPAPTATATAAVYALQTATPLGPPANPLAPAFTSSTPDPTPAAQAIERRDVPTVKWTGPSETPSPGVQRAPASVVTGNDTGGQGGYGMWSPLGAPIVACYALVSVVTNFTLPAGLDGGFTVLYGPTLKCPLAQVEPGMDHWADASGNMSHFLRFYDFVNGRFSGPNYDLTDPAFLGKYVGDFGNGHGPQLEILEIGQRIFAHNIPLGTWDVLYTNVPGTPLRLDGWNLLLETHFQKGIVCPRLPTIYADAYQVFQTVWTSDGVALAVNRPALGDCFAAGTPGAYYEMAWPAWPSFSQIQATSIGP